MKMVLYDLFNLNHTPISQFMLISNNHATLLSNNYIMHMKYSLLLCEKKDNGVIWN